MYTADGLDYRFFFFSLCLLDMNILSSEADNKIQTASDKINLRKPAEFKVKCL